MTILITGATGQVGGAALAELAGTPVRVLVRDPTTFAAASPDRAAHPGTAVPPDRAGHPDAAAPPDRAGHPDAAAPPDRAGHPDAAAPPDRAGHPDAAAPPDGAARRGAAASPDGAGRLDAAPPPDVAGRRSAAAPPDRAGRLGAAAPPATHLEVFGGSFDDVASLRAALDGVSVLFLTGRDNPDQVEQHLRVLGVAREVGVRHVVKLSAIGARANSPVALMRWHHAIEEALRASSFAWTFLRPHLYMQNLLRFAEDVSREGRLAAPMGARRYPLVDTRDVGAAAAAVLRDPSAHAGHAYALTGPAALGYREIAAQLAALVGRPVAYDALAPDGFRAGLLDAGIPAWRADDLAAIGAAYDDADNTVSDGLHRLLYRAPTSFERFVEDHRETYLAGASRSHL